MNDLKVVIDAGHGGSDPGAVSNGVNEKDLNLMIAKYMLECMEFEEAYDDAVESLRNIYKYKQDYLDEFENNILPDGIIVERGTGYVIDCLKTAFKVIRESSSYEEAIKKAISFGNDTDTTAAVVGGLAGIIYGFESIPTRWYELLRGKEEIIKLIDKINFENENIAE